MNFCFPMQKFGRGTGGKLSENRGEIAAGIKGQFHGRIGDGAAGEQQSLGFLNFLLVDIKARRYAKLFLKFLLELRERKAAE